MKVTRRLAPQRRQSGVSAALLEVAAAPVSLLRRPRGMPSECRSLRPRPGAHIHLRTAMELHAALALLCAQMPKP